jgi:hypothetical protein
VTLRVRLQPLHRARTNDGTLRTRLEEQSAYYAERIAGIDNEIDHLKTLYTSGAFLFGLRLMAIDGTSEDVPDTEANAKAFGRHTSARGASAFPQLQGVYLVECGTHVVVDAGFWPCQRSERVGSLRLLRSVKRGMLLTARQRGAHILGRLPAHVKPLPLRTLPDGSVLAYLLPSDYASAVAGAPGHLPLQSGIAYTLQR